METMSNTSIHGHAILHHIQDNGPVSRPALESWANSQFGTESRYHACFASDLAFPDMIEALVKRGKISEGPQGFVMGDGADICEHE